MTSTDLAANIGNNIPLGSRVDWTTVVEVNIWDATGQSQTTYQVYWDGTGWNDLGSSIPLNVGDMYTVTVPLELEGVTYTLSGNIPSPGSVSFVMRNVTNGNVNWITTPASITGVNTTTDLAANIGNLIPLGSRVDWTTVVEVNVWDAALQSQTTYQVYWDGTGWNDLGSSVAVSIPGPYKVTVPIELNGGSWNP
jgi:hypothetical protein